MLVPRMVHVLQDQLAQFSTRAASLRLHRTEIRTDPAGGRPERVNCILYLHDQRLISLLSAIQDQSEAAECAKGIAVNAKLQLAGARLENDVTHRTLTLLKLQRDSALEDVELAR